MQNILHSNRPGYTLIEMLTVIAVVAMISGIAFVLPSVVTGSTELDQTTEEVAEWVNAAHTASLFGINHQPHGVYLENNQLVQFVGSSFATRDVSLDRWLDIPSGILLAGTKEIVFSSINGEPNVSGGWTLSKSGFSSRSINVNILGTVDW